MADFSADFMEYLKIYNPTAYDKANTDGIKPEELASIYSANAAKFEVWDSIPAEIRNRYSGQPVPQDVWEAAARGEIYTLREMEYNRNIKQISEAREKAAEDYGIPTDIVSDMATATFISALAAGYASETSYQLALNRQYREGMLENRPDKKMNKKEYEEWLKNWLATREKDANAIIKDWKEHQPEKYLMHLLFKHNRGKLTISETKDFPQIVQDLMQRIEAVPDRMAQLLSYIKHPRMQARIGRFNEETMKILTHTVLRKVPEADREQYLAKDFAKRREELRNMPDISKARMVSDSISSRAANLPEENTLTAKERLVNMPSALNQGMER